MSIYTLFQLGFLVMLIFLMDFHNIFITVIILIFLNGTLKSMCGTYKAFFKFYFTWVCY